MADETDKQRRARELYERGIVHYPLFGGSGGAGAASDDFNRSPGGGGGWVGVDYGAGGHVYVTSNRTDPLVPDLSLLDRSRWHQVQEPTEEEKQEMEWVNREAAEVAADILSDERKSAMKEAVAAAVAHFREMLEGASCGSVFRFRKDNDEGKHYWYAAIKSGKAWYTTANTGPRVLEDDDALIHWLISLGAHEAPADLSQGEAHVKELAGPIETTATEEA